MPEPAAPSNFDIRKRAWSRSRQLRVLAIAAAVLALLAVTSIWSGHLRTATADEGTAPGASAPAGTFRPTPDQLKTLTIGSVAEQDFQQMEVTDGSIALNGDLTTPVYSPYSGRVTRVIARPGDVLPRGAALAEIDASEFVQGQNDVLAAVAQVKLARVSEARKKALYEAQGGSLQDWQQAQADLATAEVSLNAARNRLRILGLSDAQINALEAGEKIDAGAVLRAPIQGVVVDREVGPGQYVQAGSGTALYTLADLSSVWLVANVREEDAPLVHKGQAVEVTVGAFPGRVFKAKLNYIAATLDATTHRLPVRAEVANADGALKPAMFASFRIISSDGTRSPAVPESAIVYDGPVPHVWVVAGSGSTTAIGLRSITVGHTRSGLVQVLDGLHVGERVVIRGSLFIDRALTGD